MASAPDSGGDNPLPAAAHGYRARFWRAAGRVMLSLALLFTIVPRRAAAAAGNNNAATATAAATDPGATADTPEKQLTAEFSRTVQGREVMRFAQAHGVTIGFDDSLQKLSLLAQYNPATGKAALLPTLAPEEQILDLAHELRHSWQDKILKFAAKEDEALTPEQRWALRRTLEADGCAYSAYFEAVRIRQLGINPKTISSAPEAKMAANMAPLLDADGNIAPADYRSLALEPCFSNLSFYNDAHLAYIADKVAEFDQAVAAAGQSPQQASALVAAFDRAADDKAFETYLRRFGGTSWDPKAPTALQAPEVTADQVLNKYPRRKSDPEARIKFPRLRDEKLDALSGKYDAQRRKLESASRLR